PLRLPFFLISVDLQYGQCTVVNPHSSLYYATPLKPWRHHLWLSPKAPRDETFVKNIKEISSLYTRPLNADEIVLCVDEKTN
ncbi:hypothetical protein, partial [Nostoc sp.]|uniref:hypothetical protein n=1 Tax=Nostoc sp. TaxID=1180 RepID=UPI002FFC6600